MKIWIDLMHTPQFNYYLNFIRKLVAEGHTVYLTILERGRLHKICKNDLQKFGILGEEGQTTPCVILTCIGRHRMTKWSAILEANVLRIPLIVWWHLRHPVVVSFSNSSHSAMACWLTRTRAYCFGDDPQVRDYKPRKWFANHLYFCIYDISVCPDTIKPLFANENPSIVRCLKEWASLAPNVFKYNVHALDAYGVTPKEYIFLREVSVGTVNYAGQAAGAIRDVARMIEEVIGKREEVRGKNDERLAKNDETFHVLFSLEEKNRRAEYPADWILLQEPIEDIHSLIYYSAGLVSSGDSMAREAALLGVPSYYLGVRHSMPANLAASKVAGLQNTLTMPFEQWLNEVRGSDIERIEDRTNRMMQEQEALRKKIDEEFIDINAYMLSLVEQVQKKLNINNTKMKKTFNLQEWQHSVAEYPEVDFDNAAEKLLAAYHTAQQSQYSHESLCQLCIMADAVYDRLVCSGITQAISMEEWKKLCMRIKEEGLRTEEWKTIGQRLEAEYGLPAHEWPEL